MVVSHCDRFQIISLACVVRAFIKFMIYIDSQSEKLLKQVPKIMK